MTNQDIQMRGIIRQGVARICPDGGGVTHIKIGNVWYSLDELEKFWLEIDEKLKTIAAHRDEKQMNAFT